MRRRVRGASAPQERVSPEDRQALADAVARVTAARQAEADAQTVLAYLGLQLREKYKLPLGAVINTDTGVITRTPPAP